MLIQCCFIVTVVRIEPNKLQKLKPWTKILLVVNVGSRERSNRLNLIKVKYEKSRDYCKADTLTGKYILKTLRLARPASFRFGMQWNLFCGGSNIKGKRERDPLFQGL